MLSPKNKKRKALLSIFVVFSLLLSVSKSFAQTNIDIGKKEVVKIGAIIPLTTGQASRGEDITRLLNILQTRFNKQSEKYFYEFVVDDGKCGFSNSASTIAMKFINIDKIHFLLTGCSGETLQVGPIAQRSRVLDFAIHSNHKDVKTLGDYVFRTFIDVERGIERFSRYIRNNVDGKIVILTEENAFTLGMKELLLKYLGDKVAFSEDFQAETNDFSSLLARIRASKVKAVYYNSLTEVTLANLVNKTRDQKMDVQIFSYAHPEVASFRKATGHNSDGLIYLGSPPLHSSSPEFIEVYNEFIKKYGQILSFKLLLRSAFDAVVSIRDGIEAVGPDPSKVKDFLKTYTKEGALGTVEYDENGDIKNINYAIRQIQSNGTDVFIDFYSGYQR